MYPPRQASGQYPAFILNEYKLSYSCKPSEYILYNC